MQIINVYLKQMVLFIPWQASRLVDELYFDDVEIEDGDRVKGDIEENETPFPEGVDGIGCD